MATAASTPLPPCLRMAAPTSEARCCAVTTMPERPSTASGDAASLAGPSRAEAVRASKATITPVITRLRGPSASFKQPSMAGDGGCPPPCYPCPMPELEAANDPGDERLIEPLSLARRHRQAGQMAEAEIAYLRVLERQPDHAEALHFVGFFAHQAGRHEEGPALIGPALAAAPG